MWVSLSVCVKTATGILSLLGMIPPTKQLASIPLLGMYPKECESGYNKGTCTSMFIAALFQ
jgi:hypothetical protein